MNSSHELGLLLEALSELAKQPGPRAALATLTRTHGSTFRRPGTRMLVHEDGRVVCELSGGCPQRDIVMQAQRAIECGEPRLIHYNADSGLDVLMEMGCGGELEVLLEPLTTSAALDFVEPLARSLQQRRKGYLATLFAIDERIVAPRRQLSCENESIFDGLGDESLSAAILRALGERPVGEESRQAVVLRLPSESGLAEVLIEPVSPPHALVVIGTSAAARALLPLALALGWLTTWVDHDAQQLQMADPPPGLLTACTEPASLPGPLTLDRHTSVLVMTHNLERDTAWLTALSHIPLAYLGTLGSRERISRLRQEPRLAGARLHAPAGLDIGSETPQEIALALAAEVMAVTNGRGGGPLRDNSGAIH